VLLPYFSDPAEDVAAERYSESDLFLQFLRDHITQTIVIVGYGDINAHFSYRAKLYLIYRGSNIIPLRNGSSYIVVLQGAEVAYEEIGGESALSATTASSEALRRAFPGKTVTLRSTGAAGAGVSVNVDGTEYAPNRRGLNVVVFDRSMNVTERAVFETGR
jgi:hypothetical protein